MNWLLDGCRPCRSPSTCWVGGSSAH